MTFPNSLDPDQDQQNVGPDLDSIVWHFDSVPEFVFLSLFFEKVYLKKNQMTTTPWKTTQHAKSFICMQKELET